MSEAKQSDSTDLLGSLRQDAMALARAINPLVRATAPDPLTCAAAARVMELQADEIDRLRGIVPEVLERLNDELCAENERLRAALADSCEEHRAEIYDTATGGGCMLLHDAVAAERERWEKAARAALEVMDDLPTWNNAGHACNLLRECLGPNAGDNRTRSGPG